MQKNNVLSFGLVFFTALVTLLPGCFGGADKCCSASVAKKEGLVVLSTLDSEFNLDCRIKGAENSTLEGVEKFAEGLDKEKVEVVVYCSDYRCSTSKLVAKKLKELGVQKVYVFEEGIAGWYQANQVDPTFALEGPCNEAYLKNVIEKPLEEQESEIETITAQELKEKMQAAGMLSAEAA